jgi:TrmH family RNA methyltransferase
LEIQVLSKAEVKALSLLGQRRADRTPDEVVVEGPKLIQEALKSGWQLKWLLLTESFVVSDHGPIFLESLDPGLSEAKWRLASPAQMDRLTGLSSSPPVWGVVSRAALQTRQRPSLFDGDSIPVGAVASGPREGKIPPWWLALDQIQDPGNLGTMIRIADWYGFKGLLCSHGTVDCFNPKVLQASMGSVFRVPVSYTDLNKNSLMALTGLQLDTRVWQGAKRSTVLDSETSWLVGSVLGAEPLDQFVFPAKGGILVIGNESKGIHQGLQDECSHLISIPAWGRAESLNASVAAGILAQAIRQQSE